MKAKNIYIAVAALLISLNAFSQYPIKIGRDEFQVYLDEENLTASIVDDRYEIDDREYPMSKGERKLETFKRNKIKTARILEIPEQISLKGKQYTITSIGKSAFAGYNNVDHIVIPNTVTAIGEFAFFRSSIVSIDIPSTVVEIGDRAFGYCEKLKRIKMARGVKKGFDLYAESKGIKVEEAYDIVAPADNVQAMMSTPKVVKTKTPKAQILSDVDIDIPESTPTNDNAFAIIIANEEYQQEVSVPFALNDGMRFKEYCEKVLGIPSDNIHYRANATLNNMREEIEWAKLVAQTYEGEARFIIYYAGHGAPDETTGGTSYLLPIDGSGAKAAQTGYSLAALYKILGDMPSQNVSVFIDACFSGAIRGNGMLASSTGARAVALKAKTEAPRGNMVVFAAAQGNETAYPYDEMGHGLFTYYLLKKLKETKGNVTLNDLGNYIKKEVSRKAVVTLSKSQTPTMSASQSLATRWKTMKLK